VLDVGTDHPYEVPKGWCGFALKLPPKAEDLQIFNWPVAFHGCPSGVLPSVLREGSLLMPGDTLIDGSKLPNRLTRGGDERIQIYTSPSIKYSALDIYTQPNVWQGHTVRVVLQCRQSLEFSTCGETIGWTKRFGSVSISPHFPNEKIERSTRSRGGVIPYRILVGLDVVTREMEQQAEKVHHAAREKRIAAAREEEDARRMWKASQEKTKLAEREELEAQRRVDELKQQSKKWGGKDQEKEKKREENGGGGGEAKQIGGRGLETSDQPPRLGLAAPLIHTHTRAVRLTHCCWAVRLQTLRAPRRSFWIPLCAISCGILV
jgi:hypothetical protein